MQTELLGTRPGPPDQDSSWRLNLRILWWTQLFAVSGMSLLLPFLPILVRSLGVDDLSSVQRWSGAIFSAPFLFAALMTPVWGWVGDRSGRKLMVVRALLGLSVALFLMGFARTPGQLLLLRILQGTVSGFVVAAIALVSSMTPRREMGYALGFLTSAQAGGIVVGPLLGGVLADVLGFRALFFVTAGIEFSAALVVLFFVSEKRARADGVPTPSMLANARRAARFPIHVAIAGLFGTQLAILLVQPFFALFVEMLGVGPDRLSSTTGVLFGITGLAMLLAAPRWGRLGDRLGRRRALLIAFVGASVVFLCQGLVQNIQWLFVLRLFQGVFAAGMLPALYATIASHTPEAQRGGVIAFGSSATLLGGLVGPILGGYLASVIGMRPVFLISTGLFVLNALHALRLPPDHEPHTTPPRRMWELPAQ